MAAVVGTVMAAPARAAAGGAKRLSLAHSHTGERLSLTYAAGEQYDAGALRALDHFLRDHYSGSVGRIDPRLFDLLHRLQGAAGAGGAGGAGGTFEIISGFRDAHTNARLRETRGGGVARHSLHMEGRALDVRLSGVALADLRDAALALGAGGVGFYPRQQFLHVDTGRARNW